MKFFKKKTKIKATLNGDQAVEAFRHNGKSYYTYTDSFKVPAGRAICALAIYAELEMRCTAEYLRDHIKATEELLNPKNVERIRLTELAKINNNLKERLNLAPFPDHIYKLASVLFFDESENPASYDFEYNRKKIEEWKTDPDLMYFFLTIQFQDLMPFSAMSKESVQSYFNQQGMINELHVSKLQAILSKKD